MFAPVLFAICVSTAQEKHNRFFQHLDFHNKNCFFSMAQSVLLLLYLNPEWYTHPHQITNNRDSLAQHNILQFTWISLIQEIMSAKKDFSLTNEVTTKIQIHKENIKNIFLKESKVLYTKIGVSSLAFHSRLTNINLPKLL